ncbi:hypothetical protein Peur_059941 [Populus x canadensis]
MCDPSLSGKETLIITTSLAPGPFWFPKFFLIVVSISNTWREKLKSSAIRKERRRGSSNDSSEGPYKFPSLSLNSFHFLSLPEVNEATTSSCV